MRLSTLSLSIVMAISVGLLALLRTSADDDTPDSSPPARPVSDKPVAAAETPKNPPAIPAEERPFWDSAQQFLDAYARRDAAAIGGLFTEDAEFVDEFGERTQGRAAIVTMFQGVFENSPQAMMEAVQIERVRRISDQVALEEGYVISSEAPDAPRYRSRYVALHSLAKDGTWRINTLKSRGRESVDRREHLAQLAWLIGEWVNEDTQAVVHTTCNWSPDGNYLLREFTIQTHDGRQLSGVQRIGWDPARHKLRSWTFDSEGGFFTGLWTQDGQQWLLTSTGVNAAGDTVTATSSYQVVDPELIRWTYRSLIVGDQVQKDFQSVTMVKRPPVPNQAQPAP